MPFTKNVKFVEVVNVDSKKITTKPENVEAGKVFVGSTRKLEIGTMEILQEHGDVTLLAGEEHTVGVGKNNKQYKVISAPLSEQTISNAEASEIVSGKTAWVNGEKVTGTMDTVADINKNIQAGESYTIPRGFHSGASKVNAVGMASQTLATALPTDILSGKTAWVNGEKVTGTMEKRIPLNVTINAGESYTIDAAYYPGGTIRARALSEATSGDVQPTDILSGKIAWVNGNKIVGTMDKIVATQVPMPVNGTYTIPKGYHNGLGTVVQNVETMTGAIVITPSNTPIVVRTAGKFVESDIKIAAVDSLNYKKGEDTYIINSPVNAAISSYKLPLDNWHDNATFNSYNVELKYGDKTLSGTIVINWLDTSNNESFRTLKVMENNKVIASVKVEVSTISNEHNFIVSIDPSVTLGTGSYIKVKEILATRQYKDTTGITSG